MKWLPTNCTPTGKPACVKPAGADKPGKPAKFSDSVYMSDRYICTGSVAMLSNLGAAVGATGDRIASHF